MKITITWEIRLLSGASRRERFVYDCASRSRFMSLDPVINFGSVEVLGDTSHDCIMRSQNTTSFVLNMIALGFNTNISRPCGESSSVELSDVSLKY